MNGEKGYVNECRSENIQTLAGIERQANTTEPFPPSYTPWRMVQITKVANGFCLQIGCKIFIAKTWVEASAGLAEYWQDPVKAEKKYTER